MDKGFGKYDVYTVSGSSYCYSDSTVLKNRFGIRDGQKLKKLEETILVHVVREKNINNVVESSIK